MKISKMGGNPTAFIPEREMVSKPDINHPYFSSEFFSQTDKQYQERLTALLADITEQGEKLSKNPTFPELKRYRELVRSFMGEAVGRMYSLNSEQGWDHRGRRKTYTTIKQIDQKLVELTEDVRLGQREPLKIMERLDAIRGMLVDLYT